MPKTPFGLSPSMIPIFSGGKLCRSLLPGEVGANAADAPLLQEEGLTIGNPPLHLTAGSMKNQYPRLVKILSLEMYSAWTALFL